MKLLTGMRQNILLFSLLISIVPVLLAGFLAFSHAKRVTESKVIDQLVSIADLKKKELEEWVRRQAKDIATHANSSAVKKLTKESVSSETAQNTLSFIHAHLGCLKAYITDDSGKFIASTNKHDIGKFNQDTFTDYTLNLSTIHIDDYLLTQIGLPVIRFATQITENNDNTVQGVLVLEFDLTSHLFPSVNSWPGMGTTGETLIAKRIGQEVIFLNNLRHRDQAKDKLRVPITSENALPAIFASGGDEGVMRTADYRGQPVLAVYKHIPSLNWGFVAKIDQEEAFEPIRELQTKLIIFTIITVALIIFLAIYVSNTIINPLNTIENYSRRLAKGQTKGNLDIKTGGEIGSLANSIRLMEEDLIQYQKKLLKTEKLAAIGKLSGSVAHDIRNPLGAISNSIYFLNNFLGKEIENEKFKKHMEIMGKEIERANEIISDLLDFSRSNNPNFSQGNINSTINTTLEELVVPVDIEVRKILFADLPTALYDHSQLRRILYNLAQNGIQSMPDGGVLEVKTFQRSGNVFIKISDTGEGIAEENLNDIFEPLYTTKSKGVGLGLSIAQTFIEKNKGQIECSSILGQGTSFTIQLPAITDR